MNHIGGKIMYRYYGIALAVILFDQLTKWVIVKSMNIYEQIPVIENFFYITSHRNRGAAWGILQDQMIFFYIVTLVVIAGIIYFMHTQAKEHAGYSIALAFILGGAIGNFIDRLFRQEVVDFLDFIIFKYDYPIFNVADAFLVIGVGLFIIITLLEERQAKRKKNE